MLCPVCGRNNAHIRLRRQIDRKNYEVSVCGECYDRVVAFSDEAFFDTFVRSLEDACPFCGKKYGDFLRSLTLGCPLCYSHFKAKLRPFIEKVQSASDK